MLRLTSKRLLIPAGFLIALLIPSKGLALQNTQGHVSEPLYESRLDKGLNNTEPYSYLLIKAAHDDRAKAKEYLEKAKTYSPDLPAVYLELARISLEPSVRGIFESLGYFGQGIRAYFGNFWWGFSFAGLVYVSLVFSMILSMIIVLIIRLPLDIGLFLHDVSENKKRGFPLAIALLLSLFGPTGFIAGAYFIIGLYFKRTDKAIVYASLILLLLSPALLNLSGVFLSPPSPSLRAVVAVNEGRDNKYAIDNLKDVPDFPARFSYALALKREGYYQEAINTYKSLEVNPGQTDPRLFVNSGNARYAAGDRKAAMELYKKSSEASLLPSAFYNLSRVSREMLDFVKGDEYFRKARDIDAEAVSEFVALAGPGPNRFVVDETLNRSDIWKYALAKGAGRRRFSLVSVIVVLSALSVMAVFYFAEKKTGHPPNRCKRCGTIFCRKCPMPPARADMCPKCYISLVRADKLSLEERIDTILHVQKRRETKLRTAKILSCIVPGTGLIYTGKITAGFLLLWPFLFSLSALIMHTLSFAGLTPFTHSVIIPFAAALLAAAYGASILNITKVTGRGWH